MKFTGEALSAFGFALLGARCVELLGFFEAVAFSLDFDHLGAMNQTVNERDDARGVREDLAPFRKRLVGAEEDRLVGIVAAGDHLEQEIGVAVVVGEVANLVEANSCGMVNGAECGECCEESGG